MINLSCYMWRVYCFIALTQNECVCNIDIQAVKTNFCKSCMGKWDNYTEINF